MSPRARTVYRCTDCGAESPKWAGRCDSCGEWNSLVEEPVSAAPVTGKGRNARRAGGSAAFARGAEAAIATPLRDVVGAESDRWRTGIAEFDRGEYVELSREQLDHAASTGAWPWAEDESRG